MAYNVKIMEKAEEDLSEIVTYISDTLCNPKAADSLLEEFLKEKNNIADNPHMYSLSPDPFLQSEGYHRFLFKNNYIALYLIDDNKKIVSIMRIFYAKRDYGKLI
ncbi:MAG: type II toxin-antitoxin system RelE/ParE family toxin [Treponema sp.]|nr:type II toxin-antitoxin system RelE/ParE family toxin [Treponema sp.]